MRTARLKVTEKEKEDLLEKQKKKKKRGRPTKHKKGYKTGQHKRITLDWDEIKEFIQAGSNQKEIAQTLGVCPQTLYKRCFEDLGVRFCDLFAEQYAVGTARLRAAQYRKAVKYHNADMLKWLGQQRLRQSENINVNHNVLIDVSKYSIDELKQMRDNPKALATAVQQNAIGYIEDEEFITDAEIIEATKTDEVEESIIVTETTPENAAAAN